MEERAPGTVRAERDWERRGLEGRLRGKPRETERCERGHGLQEAEARGAQRKRLRGGRRGKQKGQERGLWRGTRGGGKRRVGRGHSALRTRRPPSGRPRGDCLPVGVTSGLPNTNSSHPSSSLAPGCSRTRLPRREGQNLLPLLPSFDPSSPSSRPDQAALSWGAGAGAARLHPPLVICLIFF